MTVSACDLGVCPTCEAPAGKPCTSRVGKRTTPHMPRLRLAYAHRRAVLLAERKEHLK